MKKLFSILAVFIILNVLHAQDNQTEQAQTLFGNTNLGRVAGFGGPWVGGTQFKGTTGVTVGGKGGAIFNDKIGIWTYRHGIRRQRKV